MRARRRVRGVMKWGGITLAAACLAVWAVSLFGTTTVYVSWRFPRSGVVIFTGNGALCWSQFPAPSRGIEADWYGYDLRANGVSSIWTFDLGGWRKGGLYPTKVPLWFPTLVCGAIAWTAWRLEVRSRRARPADPCERCEYDRAGLAAGAPCPECGHVAGG